MWYVCVFFFFFFEIVIEVIVLLFFPVLSGMFSFLQYVTGVFFRTVEKRITHNTRNNAHATYTTYTTHVFGSAGSNVWLPFGRFFPQTGELTADSSGRSAVGHETQKQMSLNCADTLRQRSPRRSLAECFIPV